MTLAKWEDQLQKLLVANGYEPWGLYGEYVAADADRVARDELRKYKARQKIEGGGAATP